MVVWGRGQVLKFLQEITKNAQICTEMSYSPAKIPVVEVGARISSKNVFYYKLKEMSRSAHKK